MELKDDPKLSSVKSSPSKEEYVVCLLKLNDSQHEESKRKFTVLSSTKLVDIIRPAVSFLKWFEEPDSYIIESIYDEKSDKNVESNDLVENKHVYKVMIAEGISLTLIVYGDPKPIQNVPKQTTLIQMVRSSIAGEVEVQRIQKFDSQFEEYIDCIETDLVEKNATYKVDILVHEELGDSDGFTESDEEVTHPMISFILYINDQLIETTPVPQKTTIQQLLSTYFKNPFELERLQEFDSQFEEKIDCSAESEVVEGGQYWATIKIEEVVRIEEQKSSKKKVEKRSTPQIKEKKSAKQKDDDPNLLNRVPLFRFAWLGIPYNDLNGTFGISVLSKDDVYHFQKNYSTPTTEIKIEVGECSEDVLERMNYLGMDSIQKIQSFGKPPGGYLSYVFYPFKDQFIYFNLIVKIIGKKSELNIANKSLREKLSKIEVGENTHILTSSRYGHQHLFLLAFPTQFVDNYGVSNLEEDFQQIFCNQENTQIDPNLRLKLSTAEGAEFVKFEERAQKKISFEEILEFVQKARVNPKWALPNNKQIEWKFTPLTDLNVPINPQVELPKELIERVLLALNEITIFLSKNRNFNRLFSVYKYIFTVNEKDGLYSMHRKQSGMFEKAKEELCDGVFKVRSAQLDIAEFEAQLDIISQTIQLEQNNETNIQMVHDLNAKIEEIQEWEQNGLTFIGDNVEMFHKAITESESYILVFKDRTTNNFTKCFNHLKTLPSEIDRYLLDLTLLRPKNINGNFTQIRHYKKGILITKDILKAEDYERNKSLARCTAPERCDTSSMRIDNLSTLDIPCPKCQEMDCFWLCSDCLNPLRYNSEAGYFICECGGAMPDTFEFNCRNVEKHGDDYVPYESEALKKELDAIKEFKDKNMLILGQSGVGKSTWLNAIANYLTYETLDEALIGDLVYLVPATFTQCNDQMEQIKVTIGPTQNTNERMEVGKSATMDPKIHSFSYKGGRLFFLDTPGIGDVDGIEQDRKNISMIMDCIKEFGELHGICILMKPNEARLEASFKYCMGELLTRLHKDAKDNIVFCFTNTQGTQYRQDLLFEKKSYFNFRPGETLALLRSYLKSSLNEIDIRLNDKNLYCMDNFSFRYLCARKQGIKMNPDDHPVFVEAWNKSWFETHRLIKHIVNNKSYNTQQTWELNCIRRLLTILTEPMVMLDNEIRNNQRAIQTFQTQNTDLATKMSELRTQPPTSRNVVQKIPLGYSRTVCNGENCMKKKRAKSGQMEMVFDRACCGNCSHIVANQDTMSDARLAHCPMMRGGNCQTCGCHWSLHMQVNYHHVKTTEIVQESDIQTDLINFQAKSDSNFTNIEGCKIVIKTLEFEKEKINETAAKLVYHLKKDAMILHNEAMKEYLEQQLKNAETDSAKSGSKVKVMQLQKMLSEYEQEKSLIVDNLDKCQEGSNFDFKDMQSSLIKAMKSPPKIILNDLFNKENARAKSEQAPFNTFEQRSKNSSKQKETTKVTTADLQISQQFFRDRNGRNRPIPLNSVEIRGDLSNLKSNWKMLFKQPIEDQRKLMEKVEKNHVALESVKIDNDFPKITGTIKIRKTPGSKHVLVHCSFDNWKSYKNYDAKTNGSESEDFYTFVFDIPLPSNVNDPEKVFQFTICYKTGTGKEVFWDTNDGNNYKLSSKEPILKSNWKALFENPSRNYDKFMEKLKKNRVLLERVKLHNDVPKITGTIKVMSAKCSKHILVRYTTDNWTSYKNYEAKIKRSDNNSENTNTFEFDIPLPSNLGLPEKYFEFFICYKADDAKEEYLDSNGDKNYKLVTTINQVIDDQKPEGSKRQEVNQKDTTKLIWKPLFKNPSKDNTKFMSKLGRKFVALEKVEVNNELLKLTATIKIKIRPSSKHVFILFSRNNWKSHNNYNAKIKDSGSNSNNIETYTVDIPLPSNIESTEEKVEFRICYKIGACKEEYWDSNDGRNYALAVDKSIPYPLSIFSKNTTPEPSSRPSSSLTNTPEPSNRPSPFLKINQRTQGTPFLNNFEYNLVILRCPESDSGDDEEKDNELVRTICEVTNIEKEKVHYIYRQGRKKYNFVRPIMIHFTDTETPKVLLKKLKKCNMAKLLPKGAWIQHDLSEQQKQVEHKTHMLCNQMNSSAGKKKFYVNDNFEIVPYEKPRDLNKN